MPTVLPLEPGEAVRINRRRTGLLLGVFGLSFAAEVLVLSLAGLLYAGIVVVVCGPLYVFFGSKKGDAWVRYGLGATPVTAPEILNAVEGVSNAAKAPMTELVMVPGEEPNSIAFGSNRRWIAVTSGTTRLTRLDREALVAHELAHLRDGDALLTSAYVILAGAIELTGKALRGPGGFFLLLSVPVWPACLVVRALSRVAFPTDRQHRADVVGSLVTRYPPAMVSLLRRAGGEHATSALRVTDRFWFAPRTTVPGPGIAERAAAVAEM